MMFLLRLSIFVFLSLLSCQGVTGNINIFSVDVSNTSANDDFSNTSANICSVGFSNTSAHEDFSNTSTNICSIDCSNTSANFSTTSANNCSVDFSNGNANEDFSNTSANFSINVCSEKTSNTSASDVQTEDDIIQVDEQLTSIGQNDVKALQYNLFEKSFVENITNSGLATRRKNRKYRRRGDPCGKMLRKVSAKSGWNLFWEILEVIECVRTSCVRTWHYECLEKIYKSIMDQLSCIL